MYGNNFDNNDYSAPIPASASEEKKAGKIFAIIGFSTGLAAIIFGICPCLFWMGSVLGIVAIVFSFLGLVKGGSKVFGIIGLISGIIGLVAGGILLVIGIVQYNADNNNSINSLLNNINP